MYEEVKQLQVGVCHILSIDVLKEQYFCGKVHSLIAQLNVHVL